MGVAQNPQKAEQILVFYQKNQQFCALVIVAFYFVVVGFITFVLHANNFYAGSALLLWAIAGVVFLFLTALNLLLLHIISTPLKAMSVALAHTTDEHTSGNPPNPNDFLYSKNGMKPILEHIYSLGSETHATLSSEEFTAIKQLEEGITRSRIGVALLDNKGKILYANSRAPIQLDSKEEKRLALDFNNGEDVQLPDWIRSCRKDTIHAEKVWTRLRTTPSTRKERFFDVAASYSKGSTVETALFFIDRTNEYGNDERDLDFIAFAAHELRGPITIIRGYLEVLEDELDEKLTDGQRTLLGRISVSANRLSTYLNNILNVSRYDRNDYIVHPSEQSIYEIYDSIADDMQGRASSRNRLLQVDINPELPSIAADPSSITEVFSNLIDNAIKYSNEGGVIEVGAKVAGEFIEISVRDHGIGMPDTVVRNLFHKFYRSHRSRESVAGSGIGLYISKGIIDAHGGTVSVNSSENKGSTFTFSLPIYAAVEEKLKASDNKKKQTLGHKGKKPWISNHNMYRG